MKKIEKLASNMRELAHVTNDPYYKGVANGLHSALNIFYNKPNDPVPFDAAEGIHLFPMRIRSMNEKYELPVNHVPTLTPDYADRLIKFKKILLKEVTEIDDIEEALDIDTLVAIADLLADITVYCRSEAVRYGIPLEEVLQIVMDSNDTKLGADGNPIKDEDGKFLKGPNFEPPEPAIKRLLLERMANDTPHT